MSVSNNAPAGLESPDLVSPPRIHSQFPTSKHLGIGKLIRVWELAEPDPRSWTVIGLVPSGAVTLLYGDGGTGKSYLALLLAIQALRGRDFLDVEVAKQESVLFADAELDAQEFCRRSYQVARGVGLERPPNGLHYLRLLGPLNDAACRADLHQALRDSGATLTLLDSLTIAASHGDVKEAGFATELMEILAGLGTVVAVDHIAKPLPGTNQSDYRPFGSVFKYNLGRSVLQVVRADGGGILIRQTKSNFGPLAKPIGAAVEFSEHTVTFTSVSETDERLSGIESHLPARDRVARALAEHGPVTSAELGELLDMRPKTVSNYLSILRRSDRAAPIGEGKWVFPNSQSVRTREIRNSTDSTEPAA